MTRLRTGVALVCLLASSQCGEPPLVVGDVVCPPGMGGATGFDADGVFHGCEPPPAPGDLGGEGGMSGDGTSGGVGGSDACASDMGPLGMINEGPLPAPWSTSFEDGLCGYYDGAGFCYSDPDSAYRVVTSPVHSGAYAAAFEMAASPATGQRQTRCVRQGVLPAEAYYSAWYYVPSDLAAADTWNLFHFAGGEQSQFLRGTWDVSMDDGSGVLTAFIFDGVNIPPRRYEQPAPMALPRDRWFQLEFYLKRAADMTGEVALYQDGQEIIRRAGIMTDDTTLGQWYVGNYAGALASIPPTSSVYVDDVAVRLP